MRFFQPFIKISLLGVGPTGRPLSVHRLRRPPGFGTGRFPHALLASGPPARRCRYTAFCGHLASATAGSPPLSWRLPHRPLAVVTPPSPPPLPPHPHGPP